VAYTFCEGPVEGLYAVWIDDTQLPAENIPKLNTSAVVTITGKTTDPKTGQTADCKFNNLTQLQFWSGSFNASNPAYYDIGTKLKAGIFSGSPSFTTDMSFNGLTTIFARYEWPTTGTNPFSGSIPKLQISVMGRRVASLIAGTPESYNYGGSGYTERYSTNPAEILLDYLRHPYYGKGIANSEIDWPSFKAAAAKCNTEVEYYTGTKGPILTLNIVVPTTDTIFNNCKKMLSNFRAYLPYTQGKYKLLIEDAGNPSDILSGVATISQTFTKDDIQGDITYTGIERNSKYNLVKVNYTDPDQQWSTQTVYYPEDDATRQALKAKDGGRENTYDLTAEGITNPTMAKDLARLALYKSRYQDSITLVVSSKAMELEPGDNVYVQANILKFGTDPALGAIPWRILSIKLNNDMTYSLGLIRNPDIIYPYTRYNEVDYKFAAYIPKGTERYYPVEPRGVPIGYHPPGRRIDAPAPPDDGTVIYIPPPTDPTLTPGGGVGGTTSPPNQPGGNNPPGYLGGAPIYGTDFINVTSVSFVQASATTTYATLTFTQPTTPGYGSVMLYFKRNVSLDTVYQTREVVARPGAGQTITATIGPLITNTNYIVTSQVKYINNLPSTVTKDAFFTTQASGSTTSITNSNTTTVDGGWRLPTVPNLNDQMAQIGSIKGTVTTPTNPREMTIRFRQQIPLNGTGANAYVTALHVYFKPNVSTYWKEYIWPLPNGYVPGDLYTFTLPGLGATQYPTLPTNASQKYDFRFKFDYADGLDSVYEYAVDNTRIEYNGTTYNFNPFATPPETGDVVAIGNQLAVNHPLDSQNPDVAADPINMTIGLTSIKTTSGGVVSFYFNGPNASNITNWLGIKIYYRQILDGISPVIGSVTFAPVAKDPANASAYLASVSGINFTIPYQFVLVPIVLNTSNVRVEGANCWFGTGYVSDGTSTFTTYPADGNWFTKLGFTQTTTVIALGRLSTLFASIDPVANVLSFKRYQLIAGVKTPNAWYYQLRFQVPSTFNSGSTVYIYRRSRDPYYPTQRGLYYGLGRWERITVTTTTNSSYDATNKTFTVNLRGTTTWGEFNATYGIAGTPNYTVLYNPLLPGQASGGIQFTPYETNIQNVDDFLIVIKMGSVESIKCIALPSGQFSYDWDVDFLNPNSYASLPVAKLQTDYSNLTSGYDRNLTNYRSAPATGSMYVYSVTGQVIPITVPTVSPGVV
jgi:hypothetical protein